MSIWIYIYVSSYLYRISVRCCTWLTTGEGGYGDLNRSISMYLSISTVFLSAYLSRSLSLGLTVLNTWETKQIRVFYS